jgi:hypothetical protein
VFTSKASGCIAVSGGLSRFGSLIKLIDKGVTVEQVAKVTISRSWCYGACVFNVRIYQTIQETVDSLEMVRNYLKLVYCNPDFGTSLQ